MLCLAYLLMLWAARKAVKSVDWEEPTPGAIACFVFLVVLVIGGLLYATVPGFYFHLSLKDVQWAYLEMK